MARKEKNDQSCHVIESFLTLSNVYKTMMGSNGTVWNATSIKHTCTTRWQVHGSVPI